MAAGRPDNTSSGNKGVGQKPGDRGAGIPSSLPFERLRKAVLPVVVQRLPESALANLPRDGLVRQVKTIVQEVATRDGIALNLLEARDLVSGIVDELVAEARKGSEPSPAPAATPVVVPLPTPLAVAPESAVAQPYHPPGAAQSATPILVTKTAPLDVPASLPAAAERANPYLAAGASIETLEGLKARVHPFLLERIDVVAASLLPRKELERQISEIVAEILGDLKLHVNFSEQRLLTAMLLDDLLGLGPLEPLLADDTISDILVNGPQQVYVERRGKLELTDVHFRDNAHVMNIATRIVSRIGRRIDESSPLADARLEDGSRVNIIAPPLAIDGASISIRKFSKKSITLESMAQARNMSPQMSVVLQICGRAKLNILISGGTGSGKTTLLNALSRMIDQGERVVTIEDAAELQLQQPHVVRLETRPPNLEQKGEISMRDLVKNALRMRPDRIILGEVRGAEALDMLQAMNTGHEGSMCTLHANRPREALTRLENMVSMATATLPSKAVRSQISEAIDVIVQVSRMRDGVRRVTSIMEVVGIEGDVITTQELFRYEYEGEAPDGTLIGRYVSAGLRPKFTVKAEYFGLDRMLLEAIE